MLINDDGWLMNTSEPPLTAEILRERMVATYRDTPIDVLLWSIGGGQIHLYETSVGEMFGDGWDPSVFNDSQLRQYQNIRSMISAGEGPLAALTRIAHEEGIRFFPSVRINNHYDVDYDAPSFSRIRREHPEWRIGYGQELTPNSIEWGIRDGLNFAVPQVREYMISLVCELFEDFNTDGVEMDFQRHPGMFNIDSGFSSRHLITDMVTRIRQRMNYENTQHQREIKLAVRVPETIADCERLGIDITKWIDDGLIDILIVGGGFIPFDMRIEEFVEAAQGKSIRVYGCIESLRPASGLKTIAGIASRIWDSGADGVYLFNYFGRSIEWKQRVLKQISSPDSLIGVDKRFEIDHADRVIGSGNIAGSFRHGLPPLQLPATLHPGADGPTLDIRVADETSSSRKVTLRLRLERFLNNDSINMRINGAVIRTDSASLTTTSWSEPIQSVITSDGDTAPHEGDARFNWNRWPWYYEDIADPATVLEVPVDETCISRGVNTVQLSLSRVTDSTDPVILRDVELELSYR